MNRNKALFGGLSLEKSKKKEEDSQRPATVLDHRHGALGEVMSGKRETVVQRYVKPDKCRLWKFHDRIYHLLDETSCRDLIDGFKAAGRQEHAATVRPCPDDPDHDFELICGARRHWTACYLRWDLLIEVKELSDEEAFQLNDIDNRDRKDISDYERAQSYQKARKAIYKSQNQMAEHLGITPDTLNRLLGLADLPQPIVKAYTDIRDIKVAHYRVLAPLLKDKDARENILKRAIELKDQSLNPARLVSMLRASANPPKKKANNQLAEYMAKESRKTMLTVTRPKREELVLRIPTNSGADQKELIDAISHALGKHML
jgi:ParB family chromosome partitioning protein